MQLKINQKYEVGYINSTEIISAKSNLEVMWKVYKTVVKAKAYDNFNDFERDFTENTALMKLERLQKVKYIKCRGNVIFESDFLR